MRSYFNTCTKCLREGHCASSCTRIFKDLT